MKHKMNVCDFCCGLFFKCEDICPYTECPMIKNFEKCTDCENRFGLFLEAHSDFIRDEMGKGNIKPFEEIEFEYFIKNVESDSIN
ncbi:MULTISPECIES: hypothetical protein [Faecalicoccus]|uniref:hypothetical protein n=1 Tax=Faecalicoccus TaxID=1573536 RepID=UPI001961E106|nr:hypothetical protein [Faecalicoccus pleomorphus]MBM6808393.1 hypothetical protein [Faecalicoccus pleomorphus]